MKIIYPILRWTLSLIFAFLLIALLVKLMGDSPMVVFESLLHIDLGYTLFYATSFIFTGLSVALCFRGGLFNIGAEGQLYMGSLGLSAMALTFGNLGIFGNFLALLFMIILGALWGAIPGILKAYRGSHEVIITIMMNFIGISLTSYVILYILKNPSSQIPESSEISSSYHWTKLSEMFPFFEHSPANVSFFLAILMAILVYLFLWKSRLGYELRVVGQNQGAAKFAGIDEKLMTILLMALGGVLSSFVAVNEVFGNSHRLRDGFSPGYGFVGIAVALLGRCHPFGVVLSALLFGALFTGARNLDLDTRYITQDLSNVIQAIIIVVVAAQPFIKELSLKKILGKNFLRNKT